MRRRLLHIMAATGLALPGAAAACDQPVCLITPDAVALAHVITFDDLPSAFGIGRAIDDVLVRPGARFGERFAGQARGAEGDHDRIEGLPLPPLTVIGGGPGETLGVMRMLGTNILLGHGPRGFPNEAAVGEGAIAVLFDEDQAAFGFELRGGERGRAQITFLTRDGRAIHALTLGPVGEAVYTFQRGSGVADIAGFVLVNDDPEGIAIDNLRFGTAAQLG